ncbi:galactokinase [Blautia argi]|uniref:Galactokinase n=1 Tax=Blautia argi TaxID=1912897 RepID=A0A2Z4UDK8_9FIRM|nr:galactokinase family protein [Blautia argi]AWY99110.1 galactokinase [Blautia argi]
MQIPNQMFLKEVYGETEKSSARFESLAQNYKKYYHSSEMEFFSAPGRTEIVGNHTDHNGGKVIAASISMDTIGAAFPNHSNLVEIISEGYDKKVVIDITEVDKVPKNHGTVSLVAGMIKAVQEFGFQISGFRAYISTEVISSAGVSSSASFEMLICSMINYFFNEGKMDYASYAKIGQYAENHFWDKASGLMDQMACAVGGAVLLDFSEDVAYEKVDFGFEDFGYRLVIVNTGKGHADLSQEYSDVPAEMKEIAARLGVSRLCETNMESLMEKLPEILEECENDRGILRAFHFFTENDRVNQAAEAIGRGEGEKLLKILDESGRSSWELLQNCCSLANYKEQKITLYLALTEFFLKKAGRGCCRVHGGGFAGVIMSIIAQEDVEEYVNYLSEYVSRENIYPLNIRKYGAIHLEK